MKVTAFIGSARKKHTYAARIFLNTFSENTKITEFPRGFFRILALFSKKMKFVKHMDDYFLTFSEEFIAEEYNTYKVLGEPKFNITDYAYLLKKEAPGIRKS